MLTMRPMEPDGSWGAKSRKEYILDDSGQRIVLKSGAFKTRKVEVICYNAERAISTNKQKLTVTKDRGAEL